MAVLALAAAGSAIGGAFGFASLGWTVGAAIGNFLFQPSAPDQEGPRLNDLRVFSNTEGADIPIIWGQCRVAGQPIWAKAIEERKSVQESGGKGGSGTSYTSYSYFGTFAVSFGAFEAENVRRIWANNRLIYDVSADSGSTAGAGLRFTFYKGTADQDPDPTIEASVGTGNAPAYRGKTYIVFEQLPLAEYGNRIPNIEAEIVTAGTSTTSATTSKIGTSSYQKYAQWLIYDDVHDKLWASFTTHNTDASFPHIAVIDPHSRTIARLLYPGEKGVDWMSLCSIYDPNDHVIAKIKSEFSDGYKLYRTSDYSLAASFSHSGGEPAVFFMLHSGMVGRSGDTTAVLRIKNAAGTWTKYTTTAPTGYYLRGPVLVDPDDDDTGLWLMVSSTDTDEIYFVPFSIAGAAISWGTPVQWIGKPTGVPDATEETSAVYDSLNDCFWLPFTIDLTVDEDAYLQVDRDGNVLQLVNISSDITGNRTGNYGYPLIFFSPEAGVLTEHHNDETKFYNVVTGNLEVVSNSTNESGWCWYHAATDTLFGSQPHEYISADGAYYAMLVATRAHIVDGTSISVADIIEDICARVGIDSSLLDMTALSGTVKGYRHTRRTAARNDIEPLLAFVQADMIQSDWKLKAVPRGGAAALTLDVDWIGATEDGADADDPYTAREPQAIDLPRSLDLAYISSDKNQEVGNALAKWHAGSAERAITVQFPIVMTDAEAKEKADVMLQLAHERVEYSTNLPPRYSLLEPTDIVMLPEGGSNTRLQMQRTERGANGIISCRAIEDDPEHLVSYAVAGGASGIAASIISSSLPQLVVVDGPLLRDDDLDHAGPYLAAFTYGDGFPVTGLHYSVDGQLYSYFDALVDEPNIGTCLTVPAAVDFEDWDDTNTLVVDLVSGSGMSVSEATAKAAGYAWAWGRPGRWEIVYPTSMVLQADGKWHVSHMLRGRRGTDWAMGLHAYGDYFIHLSSAAFTRRTVAVADIGETRYFKAVPDGKLVADVADTEWVVNDEPLQPYTPIGLQTEQDSSNNLTLTATSRTRRNGSLGGPNNLTDGVGSPGSEVTGYRFRILDVNGLELNTYDETGLSSTYTSAEQIADYGSLPSRVWWQVGAISSLVTGVSRWSAIAEFIRIVTYYETLLSYSPDVYLRLNEASGTTAADSSGNANDGTYQNSPTLGVTGLTPDDADKAAHFNDTSQHHVTVPGITQPGTGSAWYTVLVKPDALDTHGLMARGDRATGVGITLVMGATGQLQMIADDGTTQVVAGGGSYAAGKIYHCIGVVDRDADQLIVYLDGEEVDAQDISAVGSLSGMADNGTVGAYLWSGSTSITTCADAVIDEAACGSGLLSPIDALILAAAAFGGGYYGDTMRHHPVAYWRLGESSGTTASDETGTNDGTFTGSFTYSIDLLSLEDGDTGVTFNGSTAYVDCGSDASLDFDRTDAFTLEAWIKHPDLDGVGGNVQIFNRSDSSSPNAGWSLALNNSSGGYFRFALTNTAGSNEIIVDSPVGPYDDNELHHVMVTYDGSSAASGVKMHIDGEEVTTTVTANTLSSTIAGTRTLYLGVDPGLASGFFAGSMDEVAIYDKVLTAQNAFDAFVRGVAYLDLITSALRHWRLNETSGTSATDLVGSNVISLPAGVTLNDATSPFGEPALLVDGTTDAESKIDLGFNNALATAFTFECWIKPQGTHATSTQMMLFNNVQHSPGATTEFPAAVRYNHSTKTVTLTLSKGDDYTADLTLTSDETLVEGGWNHVAVTYSANTAAAVWVNGTKKSSSIAFTISSNSRNWAFGAPSNSNGGGANTEYLDNTHVAELLVWDTVQSDAAIQKRYRKGAL